MFSFVDVTGYVWTSVVTRTPQQLRSQVRHALIYMNGDGEYSCTSEVRATIAQGYCDV